jgi:hypothetical protein
MLSTTKYQYDVFVVYDVNLYAAGTNVTPWKIGREMWFLRFFRLRSQYGKDEQEKRRFRGLAGPPFLFAGNGRFGPGGSLRG